MEVIPGRDLLNRTTHVHEDVTVTGRVGAAVADALQGVPVTDAAHARRVEAEAVKRVKERVLRDVGADMPVGRPCALGPCDDAVLTAFVWRHDFGGSGTHGRVAQLCRFVKTFSTEQAAHTEFPTLAGTFAWCKAYLKRHPELWDHVLGQGPSKMRVSLTAEQEADTARAAALAVHTPDGDPTESRGASHGVVGFLVFATAT